VGVGTCSTRSFRKVDVGVETRCRRYPVTGNHKKMGEMGSPRGKGTKGVKEISTPKVAKNQSKGQGPNRQYTRRAEKVIIRSGLTE